MMLEVRVYLVICDKCAFQQKHERHPRNGRLPEGWTSKKDPAEHWIVEAKDYCPACSKGEKATVNRFTALDIE